jgi:hypothetical protein
MSRVVIFMFDADLVKIEMTSFPSSWTAVRQVRYLFPSALGCLTIALPQIYKAVVQIDPLPFLLPLTSLVLTTSYNIAIENTNLARFHKYRACDLHSFERGNVSLTDHQAFTTTGLTHFFFDALGIDWKPSPA